MSKSELDDVLLKVEGLTTHFFTEEGVVKSVDGVTFDVRRGEVLGLVGESGSGKSVTALSLLRLIPTPPGRIVDGAITFNGRDLLALDEAQMRDLRGNEMSTDSGYTIGFPMEGSMVLHRFCKGVTPCHQGAARCC